MSQATDFRIPASIRAELELLTPDQVCELLQVSKQWLYDQVETGGFPHVKLSHRVLRFRPAEVSAWVAGEREAPPEPEEPHEAARPRRGRPRKG